jgi:hypothetical protein
MVRKKELREEGDESGLIIITFPSIIDKEFFILANSIEPLVPEEDD